MKRLLLAALMLVSAVALAACGGGESDEGKIVSVVEKATTSTDPASCEETQTMAFIEQTNSGEGKEAVKQCEEDTEEGKGNPESVEVSEVESEGGDATAAVAIQGGSFDGQVLEVGLTEEESEWKLNEFIGFQKFDREKLLSGFEEQLKEGEVEPKLAECIFETFEESENAELEEIVINGNEATEEIVEECAE